MSYVSTATDIVSFKKKLIFNAGIESSIDYIEGKRTYSPEVQLIFSPFGLPTIPIEILGTDVNKVITSLSWTKDRSTPGGMCMVTIVPTLDVIEKIVDILNKVTNNFYSTIWGDLGVDLEDLFKPMTLCQLWINGCMIMSGTVRSCSRSASVSDDSKDVSYNIAIDELGNLYNMNTVSLDLVYKDGLNRNSFDSFSKALSSVASLKGTTLDVGIKALMDAFSASSFDNNLSLSDGLPLSYRFLTAIANVSMASFMNVDGNLFKIQSQGGGATSFWSFMKNYVPSPWMEFYTESGGRTICLDGLSVPSLLIPGFNYTVARTVPYSNVLLGSVNPSLIAETSLFELHALMMIISGDFIIITDDMIQEKEIGFDSSAQKTVFHAEYTSGGTTTGPNKASKPIISTGPKNPLASGGVKTFGIREMFQNMDMCSIEGLPKEDSQLARLGQKYGLSGKFISRNALNNLSAVWFRNQSRFREGKVVSRGIPHARPGMYCLYLPTKNGYIENKRDIGIYYIDSLSHSYSLSDSDVSFDTTLNLIRGTPLPLTLAQTALLLFDWEILPPMSGLADGEYKALKESVAVAAATAGLL